MDKTVVVSVERQFAHPMYRKIVKKTKKFMAHDEKNECNIGDTVRIIESRPLSARKRWMVTDILERAK
ncbi:MAG: 30S ribosomal protein S17 [Firmicutes bacterium]|nr:30S ribosomal protein S17 [Bacillota bacterium]